MEGFGGIDPERQIVNPITEIAKPPKGPRRRVSLPKSELPPITPEGEPKTPIEELITPETLPNHITYDRLGHIHEENLNNLPDFDETV